MQRPAAQGRLISLDVARGLMLIASVSVNAWWTAPKWFEHAPWIGIHPVDLIFPTFVTLSGCGLAFAYRRHIPIGPTVRRVVILIVVGLLYNAHVELMTTGGVELSTLRFTGVLQLYAVVVLVMALLHLITRQWWGWLLITLALATVHTLWLHKYAVGCPSAILQPHCNPSGPLDTAVFGAAHLYDGGVPGYDPEGLVSILGALISASSGATIGHLITARRAPVFPVGVGVTVTLLGAAYATNLFVPAMKRLWTAPFALLVGSGVGLVLVLLHVMLDRRSRNVVSRGVTYPLISLGRNSLFVYFGSHVLLLTLLFTYPSGSKDSWARTIADRVAVADQPALSFVVLAVLTWTLLAMVLHRFRIYLRP